MDPKSPIQLLVIIMFIHFRYHVMAIENDGFSIIFVDTPIWLGTAAVALLWFSCLWVSSSDVSSKTCSQLRFGTGQFFRRESRLSQLPGTYGII